MTREEFMDIVYSELHSDGDNYRANRIIDAADEYAEEHTKWIPVSEMVPEIHQHVLLSLRSLDIVTGFRGATEPYFYCDGAEGCYVEPQNVLAWQPLPEPYKEEE